jgi:DNA-binding response OmpR family regulator
MMPGLDGIAALRADAETASIPVIFLTAKAEKLEVCAGMNVGADDYITKLVAKADLLSAIRSRLERAIQQAVTAVQTQLTFCRIAIRKIRCAFGVPSRVMNLSSLRPLGSSVCRLSSLNDNSATSVAKVSNMIDHSRSVIPSR